MKNHPQDSMFAFLLMAVAVPTVLIGVLTVSAEAEIQPEIKSMHHQLFESGSFRLNQRRMNEVKPVEKPTVLPHAATAVPASAAGSGAVKTEAKVRPIIFEDLDLQQRETLRKQLRIGGCPQDAMPGYKELCETMLKKQKHPDTKKGLRHPNQ